jgi:phosphomannomutase
MYKALVFDLDGTLTEPRQSISSTMECRLEELRQKYQIIILGAGNCHRIYNQINHFDFIYIFGNYGLEAYHTNYDGLHYVYRNRQTMNLSIISSAIKEIREKYQLTHFKGLSFELHPVGMVTFALLGTEAKIEDKLRFDPNKKLRYIILPDLQKLLPDNTIIIGGTSSFDILPKNFNKGYGIKMICEILHLDRKDIMYFGDAIKSNENDDGIQKSDIAYTSVKNSYELLEVLNGYIS